jgi:hypothetical protein
VYVLPDSSRRPAYRQALPPVEASLLNDLVDEELYTRVGELFAAGWTLQAIGDAFDPPRQRSTVRYWMNRRHDPSPLPDAPLPTPRRRATGYVSRRPRSPGIEPDVRARLGELAPLAQRYRAKTRSDSREAQANRELTERCVALHASGVPVRELAEAAGVTYRAMARRLGR